MRQTEITKHLLNLLMHKLKRHTQALNIFRESIIGIKLKLITKNVDLIDKNLDNTSNILSSIADKIIFLLFVSSNFVIIKSPLLFNGASTFLNKDKILCLIAECENRSADLTFVC